MFWSSHASFHVLPLGLHSDLRVRRLVGNGWSEGVTYGWQQASYSAAIEADKEAADQVAVRTGHPYVTPSDQPLPTSRR
uniref:hypothetical protein n=1 Tax=Streptomyces antimycoticus TaxID=68175 RepID=UPI001374B2C9